MLNNFAWVLATSPDDDCGMASGPSNWAQSLRTDRVQAVAHPQHAGRRLRRNGRLRLGPQVVREIGRTGGRGDEGTAAAGIGELSAEEAVARRRRKTPQEPDAARPRSLSVGTMAPWPRACMARRGNACDRRRKHGTDVRVHAERKPAAPHAGGRGGHAGLCRRFGEDEETWGIVGLLHDFDYERWPQPPDHPLQGAAILAAARLS